MAEYERSRRMAADPEDVFAFVADVGTLPTYLPTVRAAEIPAEGRVRVQGEARGTAYEDDGYLRLDPDRRRLEWGSDEADYRGWLSVGAEDGAALVTVHLTFAPFVTPSGAPMTGNPVGDDPIEQSLEAALDSLRNLIEGTGGKEEPAGA